jgi:hypothetical protein
MGLTEFPTPLETFFEVKKGNNWFELHNFQTTYLPLAVTEIIIFKIFIERQNFLREMEEMRKQIPISPPEKKSWTRIFSDIFRNLDQFSMS